MRRIWVAAVVMSTFAHAQDAPPTEPPITVGGSLTIWLPQGDADDFSSTSLGIRPHFAYRVLSFLAVVATIDYVFVNEKDGVDNIDYYAVSAGARLIKARPGRLEPYGELLLGWHKLDGEGLDDSGIGFRLGGGVTYPVGDKLVLNGGVAYSKVGIDAGIVDVDIDALVLELGLGARF